MVINENNSYRMENVDRVILNHHLKESRSNISAVLSLSHNVSHYLSTCLHCLSNRLGGQDKVNRHGSERVCYSSKYNESNEILVSQKWQAGNSSLRHNKLCLVTWAVLNRARNIKIRKLIKRGVVRNRTGVKSFADFPLTTRAQRHISSCREMYYSLKNSFLRIFFSGYYSENVSLFTAGRKW